MTTAAEARKEKQDKVAARKKKRADDLKELANVPQQEVTNGEGSGEEATEAKTSEEASTEVITAGDVGSLEEVLGTDGLKPSE